MHIVSYNLKIYITNPSLKIPSPFGSVMQGRSWTEPSLSTAYRFGFNGKDKVDEIEGDGNAYDFGARILDTRLGRWMSLDPLERRYPYLSPYNFVANNPVTNIDPDGKIIKPASDHSLDVISTALLSTFKSQNILDRFISIDEVETFMDYNNNPIKPNPNYGLVKGNGDHLDAKAFKKALKKAAKEETKKLKKAGKNEKIKFTDDEIATAYAYYHRASDAKQIEVFVTCAQVVTDNSQYKASNASSLPSTKLIIESSELVTVASQLSKDQESSRIKDDKNKDVLDSKGNPTYNTELAQKNQQITLDGQTGGNGQGSRVYPLGNILIDEGTGTTKTSTATGLLNTAIKR